MKVKTAARAAEQATKGAFSLIKERINLTEVAAAISYIDAITQAINAKDYAGALTTMRGLRAKLIALRQMPFDGPHRQTIDEHLTTLSMLSEDLVSVREGRKQFEMVAFMRAIEPISDTLDDDAGKLRYMDSGRLTGVV